MRYRYLLPLLLLLVHLQTAAADVTRPERVGGLVGTVDGNDVRLNWSAVALDVTGGAETVDHYRVYRGISWDFIPDKSGGSNLVGTSPTAQFDDVGAMNEGLSYYYLITAVDSDGNESDSKPTTVTSPPLLSGFWTASTIEVDWSSASPGGEVLGYRVYFGKESGVYSGAVDVGLVNAHSLAGLETLTNWYVAVTAIDQNGNESGFSNEHVDAVDGTVVVRAHDGDELCWGAADCTPTDPDRVQRANGWQLLVPVDFPEGDWTSVEVTLTVESRLCTPPAGGTISKCGPGNDCLSPPCNGGYNPCGDPWDRTVHMFMVLDDCVEGTGSCITHNNLELIRAVTPFGTDAEPPAGTGVVPPRAWTVDITPFTPLLAGQRRHVGVEIGHFVQKGHWVTADFTFTERPDLASPKPPADGIEIIGFGDFSGVEKQISVPATATEVKMRLYTTGHGGTTFCDGGPNDGMSCSGNAECPSGVCNPCDEFCHRQNQITVNGAPRWRQTPWRTDCSPGPSCTEWNACGFPSCTFPRAGWCPGYVACHHDAPCDNDLPFTHLMAPGATYDLDYQVVPLNGSWTVSLVAYWYE